MFQEAAAFARPTRYMTRALQAGDPRIRHAWDVLLEAVGSSEVFLMSWWASAGTHAPWQEG